MPGWFDFINGQTLPASRVQEFLMDQSVMKFADSGSRAAALPFPTDGMVSYLTDSDRLFVWRSSSSAWVQIAESTNLAALSAVLPTRRNAVINGGFDIWQRGTTINTGNGAYVYTADRWQTFFYGSNTATVSRQTFTPGSAPVAGYEGEFFLRATSSSTSTIMRQMIEDVRTLAGQTVTFSFWAKAAAPMALTAFFTQLFGSGGSTAVDVSGQNANLTTSWQRFAFTFSLPSISGKTIGTNSALIAGLAGFGVTNTNIDLWGVQLEAGSVATPFVRAATTLQGELAACQRYYYRNTAASPYSRFAQGASWEAASARLITTIPFPVSLRVAPSSVEISNLGVYDGSTILGVSSASVSESTINNATLSLALTSSATAFRPYELVRNAGGGGFVGFSAEL
jgi:hypothetical protein